MFRLPTCVLSLALLALAQHERSIDTRAVENPIAAAWYTGWHATDFPLSAVSWSKYTHITYAFGITTPDVNVLGLDISDELRLPEFVLSAHEHGVKALLSVGGWTGSKYFSTAVGSERNRTAFVRTLSRVVERFNLDGIDFDWEYPGAQGLGCNVVSPDDTTNFLLFLQEFRRTTLGQSIILSAAVYITPFVDASGAPSTNVSGYADALDYIAIMNYDLKSNTAIGAGPSSPIEDSCAPSGAKWGSAASSVAAWTRAGIPSHKLVLGVGAYGHSYVISPSVALDRSNGSSLRPYPQYNPGNKRIGDRWDGEGGLDSCGVMNGPGGVYTYWGLIEEGFLRPDGTAAEGVVVRHDECSETPFAYKASSQIYVSFENARSFAAKGDFIHSSGLAGFAIWEAGGDRNDTLLDAIRHASLHGNREARTQRAIASASERTDTSESGSNHSSPHARPSSFLLFVVVSLPAALVFLSPNVIFTST